jgi:hypothetical protein
VRSSYLLEDGGGGLATYCKMAGRATGGAGGREREKELELGTEMLIFGFPDISSCEFLLSSGTE